MDKDRIISLANEISEAFRTSDSYKTCEELGRKICEDEELRVQIEYYKNRRTAFCIKKLRGDEITIEDEKELSKLYFDLCMHENAKHYIDSRDELLQLAFAVQDIVAESFKELDIWS